MVLFVISFLAGVLTVLAPCVLPLLPVIVGSSVAGEEQNNKRKALIVATSLGVSIIIFTLLLKVSTVFINIPPTTWAIISGIIIIIFGLVSLFPTIWEKIPIINKLNRSSNKLLATGYKKNSFWGDIIIGASLGPVFSTCSPVYFVILATVLPLSFFLGLVDLIAYAVGLGGALLVIAFVGQKITARFEGLSDTHGWFKRSLGVLFILIGIGIMFGYDKKVEASLLTGGVFDVTRVEQFLLSFNKNPNAPNLDYSVTNHGPQAPEIVNPSGFINTDGKPITIGEFKGKKVVLIDFWTYSCINCQRTLPYVKAWYDKYKDQGLEVISIHTPEFAFEKVQSNVQAYVTENDIKYPVVLDNDYSTWNAFGNEYWPRKYLINEDGEIIYDHIGEGSYDETEKAIQNALAELNQKNNTGVQVSDGTAPPINPIPMDENKIGSPETYFGSSRNQYLANGIQGRAGDQTLKLPTSFILNNLYLDGTWEFSPEFATAKTSSKIVFPYNAKNVYMVASADSPITVSVLEDGVKVKDLKIQANTLYHIIDGNDYGAHTLEIDTPAGLNAFTFTFG